MSLTNIFNHTLQAQKNKVWGEEEGWFGNSFDAPEGYTLEQAVDESDAIFEGELISSKVYRGMVDRDSTYTVRTIKVSRCFKGKVDKIATLLMPGGLLWDEVQPDGVVPGTPGGMPKGSGGIFFAKKNTTKLLKCYDLTQFKCLEINKDLVSVYFDDIKTLQGRNSRNNDVLNKELEERFYTPIEKQVGKKSKTYKKLLPKPKKVVAAEKAATDEVEILGLYLLSVPAGLLGDSSLLTIIGTGFGAEKGKVFFKDTETPTYFKVPNDHIRKWENDSVQGATLQKFSK